MEHPFEETKSTQDLFTRRMENITTQVRSGVASEVQILTPQRLREARGLLVTTTRMATIPHWQPTGGVLFERMILIRMISTVIISPRTTKRISLTTRWENQNIEVTSARQAVSS